jgi:presenilin-like A22 family membrane protease
MNRRRFAVGLAGTLVLFVLVQIGALGLVEPFDAVYEPVEDPSDPTNSAIYVGAILVATAVMLAAFHYALDRAIRAALILVSALLAWYVLQVVIPSVVTVSGLNVLALLGALGVATGLYVYPEWYVVDGAGVLMGAGAAGLFGISFGPLPAIVLLSALAVYDAISVYGTEHMLTLAGGVMELRVPVVLVVPLTLSYSFLADDAVPETAQSSDAEDADQTGEDETADDAVADEPAADDADAADAGANDTDAEASDATDRDALFVGLGDAVMPTIMVTSAAAFAPVDPITLGVAPLSMTANLPALTAAVGTLAGVVVLIWLVAKGRAHAGLPLLNGGAIGGYLLGALASGLSLATAVGLA